jgi:hypothetical protein
LVLALLALRALSAPVVETYASCLSSSWQTRLDSYRWRAEFAFDQRRRGHRGQWFRPLPGAQQRAVLEAAISAIGEEEDADPAPEPEMEEPAGRRSDTGADRAGQDRPGVEATAEALNAVQWLPPAWQCRAATGRRAP